MVSRYYRDKLHAALTTANDESIASSSNDWRTNATLLSNVADSIRASSKTLDSEIKGDAGKAMVSKFRAISDKLELDSADMQKGAGALAIAHTAALDAIKTRNGIQLSGPMNQTPTKPEGPTPGTQATPEQETAMGNYNKSVKQYEANEQAAEDNAREALRVMDQQYAEAAVVMKEIHGEPDPEQPSGPNVPTNGSTPPPVGPTMVPTNNPPNNPPKDPPKTNWPPQPPPDPPTWPPVDPPVDPPVHPPVDPPVHPPVNPPTEFPPHHPVDVATTNVQGGTDGGTSYQGVNSGTSPAGDAGSTSAAVGGGAAAGAAGAGLGAGMMKGGAMGGSVNAASAGSVRSIGAGGRAGAPSSLGRGATAAGSTSRASSSSARAGAARTAGGASRAGAAGSSSTSKGSATKGGVRSGAAKGAGSTSGRSSSKGAAKGKGLFRRGSNGSTTGGRSNKKKDDERSTESDSLVYEQDWLGDDTAAPSVLD